MERREGMGAGSTLKPEVFSLEPRRRFTVVDRTVLPLRADYYEGYQSRAQVIVEGRIQQGYGVGRNPREAYKDALKSALHARNV